MVALHVAAAEHGFLDSDKVEALLAELRSPPRGPRGVDDDFDSTERRGRGVFFTPFPLVDFVVDEVVRARASAGQPIWRDGQPTITALDPAGGDGRFIEAVAERLPGLDQVN